MANRLPGAGDNRTLRLDGGKVKALRRAKGFSRDGLEAASKSGPHKDGRNSFSTATIKRAEHGEPIYVSNAHSLAVLLETPLHELLLPGEAVDQVAARAQPMIAVMPLHVADGDTGPFADGLAEDLITRLRRFWFPIIERPSSLVPSLDPRSAAKALGAKYWVDGTVRRAAGEIRVTVQLADVDTGAILARYPYERRFADVFELQHELTAAIVADLSPQLLDVEVRRLSDRDPKDLDAWHQALLGAWHFYRRTPGDNAQARSLLGEALHRDRHMPLAWYTLALTHQQDLINQWSEHPQRSIAALQEVGSEFERYYPDEAGAQVACAYLDVYKGQRDSAMARLAAAIDIDPNTCLAYTLYGQTLAMAGEPDRGLEQFDVALRLNPKDTERWSTYVGMALAHFVAERYEDAVASATNAVRVRPSAAFPYAVLASAHALLGNLTEARQALRTMLHLQPSMSARGIAAVTGSTDKDIGKRFLEGLRRAGLAD